MYMDGSMAIEGTLDGKLPKKLYNHYIQRTHKYGSVTQETRASSQKDHPFCLKLSTSHVTTLLDVQQILGPEPCSVCQCFV